MRHGPREQEQDAPRGPAAEKMLVQRDRQQNADGHLQQGAGRGPDDGFAEGDPELGFPENQRVLREPREFPTADAVDARVGERQQDIEDERIQEHEDEHGGGWQQAEGEKAAAARGGVPFVEPGKRRAAGHRVFFHGMASAIRRSASRCIWRAASSGVRSPVKTRR